MLTKEDAEGRLILSKKRARFELAWKAIEQAAESGEPVNGRVIEVVKGGLILDLGVRGFLPASLVDIRRVQDLDEFLGQELRAKVIELNRSRNNVVLSRRAVLEEERKEQRQQILDKLQPGDVVEGQISNIVDFGAFVDLDGMDGLIHISELSWSHVNHPSEVLEIGQTVEVKVLDIDRDRQRISLGLKQTQSDPWQQVIENYHENDVVEGRVTKVVTFGAFVEILPGVEGLVHISELAQHHVENPREVVSQGQPVNVKIIEVDGERRRLSLSLKRVEDTDPVQPRADRSGVGAHPAGDRPVRGRLRRLARAAAGLKPPRWRNDEAVPDESRPGRPPPAEDEVPAAGLTGFPLPRPMRLPLAETDEVPTAEADATGAGVEPAAEPKRPLRGVTKPVAVAITGGIGAGKSEALRAFARHGAATVSSDEIVHHLLLRRPEVRDAVVEHLGHGVVAPDGEIDRGALATVVFNDREALAWLESLLHPLVSAEYLQWREHLAELPDAPRVCVTEVPLLYETGADARFDKVVVITAPEKLRRARSTGRNRGHEKHAFCPTVRRCSAPTSRSRTPARSRSWTRSWPRCCVT